MLNSVMLCSGCESVECRDLILPEPFCLLALMQFLSCLPIPPCAVPDFGFVVDRTVASRDERNPTRHTKGLVVILRLRSALAGYSKILPGASRLFRDPSTAVIGHFGSPL